MKRIVLFSVAAALATSVIAKNSGAPTIDNSNQHHTPASALQPDEYMANTIILKVRPEYRSACTNSQIQIPAVIDYFVMIGADNIRKIYPNKKAPETAKSKTGLPMIDL